jgi:hypothetical protein
MFLMTYRSFRETPGAPTDRSANDGASASRALRYGFILDRRPRADQRQLAGIDTTIGPYLASMRLDAVRAGLA